MAGPARVSSIQALREFMAALIMFADEARSALESADAEIARRAHTTNHDLPRRWRTEQRRMEEQVVCCKIELENALSMADMGKSSVDERRALARSKEGVENARHKLASSKRWGRELDRERTIYRGQAESLSRIIESVIPRALARLERMTDDLERYTHVTLPGTSTSAADVERTMAFAVPNAQGAAADDYERARALRPTADTVCDAPVVDDLDAPPGANLPKGDRKALVLLTGDHPPADLRLDVAYAPGDSGSSFLVQRDDPVDERDSGWRIHGAEGGQAWVRVPGVRLLRTLPDLASIARLPEGTVVCVECDGVRSLFDTIGSDVWQAVIAPEKDDM